MPTIREWLNDREGRKKMMIELKLKVSMSFAEELKQMSESIMYDEGYEDWFCLYKQIDDQIGNSIFN